MPKKSKKKTLASTKKTVKNEAVTHSKTLKLKTNFISGLLKKMPQSKPEFQAGVVMIVGVAFLAFAGFFLFEKIFRPQPLADLLPINDTVAYFELNIDGKSRQLKNFYRLMNNYQVYQPDNFIKLVNAVVPIDYMRDLEPWIGRKAGLAVIKETGANADVKPLLFVETKNAEKTISFLKNHALASPNDGLNPESYRGFTLYSYKISQSFHFLLMGNYVIIAENANLLKQLVDSQLKPMSRLKDDAVYQKVNNNLPQGALAFAYVNVNKFFETFMARGLLQNQKANDLAALQPFIKIFQAEGFVLFANDKNLTIQSFTGIDRNGLNGLSYLTFSEKYQAELLSLANENPILLAGGHDLYKELQRIQEIFKVGTRTSNLIFEGLIEAQKQKYLGKEISLAEDFYPLLKGEYLVSVDNDFVNPVVNIFLELNDKANNLAHFEKIVKAFIKIGAIFSPQVQNVTLPDSTIGQEVVASAEEITRGSENYQNIIVTTLQLGKLNWSINYAVLDNILAISTSTATLKTIIDRKIGRLPKNFKNSEYFQFNVKPFLRGADEFFHLKPAALASFLGLGSNNVFRPYLEPFTSLGITKNYFDDGISTIYLVDVLGNL